MTQANRGVADGVSVRLAIIGLTLYWAVAAVAVAAATAAAEPSQDVLSAEQQREQEVAERFLTVPDGAGREPAAGDGAGGP